MDSRLLNVLLFNGLIGAKTTFPSSLHGSYVKFMRQTKNVLFAPRPIWSDTSEMPHSVHFRPFVNLMRSLGYTFTLTCTCDFFSGASKGVIYTLRVDRLRLKHGYSLKI